MGKLEDNSPINHFSHQHPLNLQNSLTNATCIACDMSVSGTPFYTCVLCDFYLHKTCSNLPRTLKHQSDKSHDLVLLSSPAYPEGVFNCNACNTNGTGFSYHCADCQLDLHVVCASMPLLINHAAHGHKLGLCFRPPYENYQGFSCDICARPGSNQWLYRCGLCDFDAHMECVTSRTRSKTILSKSTSLPCYKTQPPQAATPPPPPPPSIKIYYSDPVQSPQVLSKSTSLPSYETYNFMPQSPPPPSPVAQPYYSRVAPAMGVPGYAQYPRQDMGVPGYAQYPRQDMGVPGYAQDPRKPSFATSMAGSAVQGVTGAVAQEILQSVFEGLIS